MVHPLRGWCEWKWLIYPTNEPYRLDGRVLRGCWSSTNRTTSGLFRVMCTNLGEVVPDARENSRRDKGVCLRPVHNMPEEYLYTNMEEEADGFLGED